MHVLDVGCGAGDVRFLLGEIVGPEGSVAGIQRCVSAGRRAFRRTGPLFDTAVGRLVLMYMRDPTDALRVVAERIRPGGVVAICEWCTRPTTTASGPDQPALGSLLQLLRETFERAGANLEIGAELFWRMRDADRARSRPLDRALVAR